VKAELALCCKAILLPGSSGTASNLYFRLVCPVLADCDFADYYTNKSSQNHQQSP
jgi:hypothetical protein